MSDEILQKLIEDYMRLHFSPATFIWQGGEPTLMGLDFYKKAVELQKKFGVGGQEVTNCLQTNAILLDDEWCQFLRENRFLVGISIDGPKEFHDYYRLDHGGCSTFDRVMRAIEKCKEHKVEFNALVLLNNMNVEHPDEIFDFFIENGIKYLQFIPCIETRAKPWTGSNRPSAGPETGEIMDFSITPQQYGEFLCKLFDRWYEHGPLKQRIRDFDSMLSHCLTGKHTICTFDRQCSQYIVVEHSGDAFCCDFFVEPGWRLGNIFETPIEKLAVSDRKRDFARAKLNLDNKCLLCRYLAVCRGGCMKHRENRVSYFCDAYKRFFDYTMPRFMQIAALVSAKARRTGAGELNTVTNKSI
jgi:uncharacterized protein